MRVLVCGGRNYQARKRLYRVLDDVFSDLGGITLIVHGNARGADRLAGDWAKARDVPCGTFDADWGRYGAKAGPMRNQKMLDSAKPDLVVAFPGGKGTAHMVSIAEIAGVPVQKIASELTTIQIRGGNLTAGLEAKDGVVIFTAPALKYMLGWNGDQVASYCKQRGWQWVTVPGKDAAVASAAPGG